ncbi:hypothetical protein HanRHA438_Chr13g0587321 [Helianthus annuus]|nr:hypothetical protein HanRHA438_Chr13g0587321 [Helianthus annuus]
MSTRNVNVDSTLCKWCGEYEETSDHLFSVCYVSTVVWQAISTWCDVPLIFHFRFGVSFAIIKV